MKWSYGYAELVTLWIQAGGPASQADTAAAIALAASGGCRYRLEGPVDVRPQKSCVFVRTTSRILVGLWQVNQMVNPRFGVLSLFDPHANARAAVAVSIGGTNFRAWPEYVNGEYRRFTRVPSAVPATAQGTPANSLGGWNALSVAAGRHLPTALRRSQQLGAATRRNLARRRRR